MVLRTLSGAFDFEITSWMLLVAPRISSALLSLLLGTYGLFCCLDLNLLASSPSMSLSISL